MTRISDLARINSPALDSVLVISDGELSKKITVSDFRDGILNIASQTTLGVVRVGSGLDIDGNGFLSVKNYSDYVLPPATQTSIGGIRVGNGLTIDNSSILSLDYQLPAASENTLGGVKVGNGLAISDGVLSANLPDYTIFDDSGFTVGNDVDLKVFINGTVPTIRNQLSEVITIGTRDTTIVGGYADFNFISASRSSALGGPNQPAYIPTLSSEPMNLGVPGYEWNNVYANGFYGNFYGVVDRANLLLVNSTYVSASIPVVSNTIPSRDVDGKLYASSFVGNLTGNADTATASDAANKLIVNNIGRFGNIQAVSNTVAVRDNNGSLTAIKFIGNLQGNADTSSTSIVSTNADNLKVGGVYKNATVDTPGVGSSSTIVARTSTGEINAAGFNGNATSATRLQTPRTINNVAFDGTSNIIVADNSKLPLSGGTVSGYITLHSNPVLSLHAVPKQYVDNAIANIPTNLTDNTKVPLAGGTMSGFLTLHSTPTQPMHAATRQYVDLSRLEVTYGSLNLSSLSTTGDVFPPAGKTIGSMVGFIPSFGTNLPVLPSENTNLIIMIDISGSANNATTYNNIPYSSVYSAAKVAAKYLVAQYAAQGTTSVCINPVNNTNSGNWVWTNSSNANTVIDAVPNITQSTAGSIIAAYNSRTYPLAKTVIYFLTDGGHTLSIGSAMGGSLGTWQTFLSTNKIISYSVLIGNTSGSATTNADIIGYNGITSITLTASRAVEDSQLPLQAPANVYSTGNLSWTSLSDRIRVTLTGSSNAANVAVNWLALWR